MLISCLAKYMVSRVMSLAGYTLSALHVSRRFATFLCVVRRKNSKHESHSIHLAHITLLPYFHVACKNSAK